MMQEGHHLNSLPCKGLLKIKGMIFNSERKELHILMPKKVSLYSYIHELKQRIGPADKFTIAK